MAEVSFPEDHFVPGWTKSGPMRRFIGSDLYNHIDGGAELFLEFGFEEVVIQGYGKGEDEITAEVYRMESPEAALGIYLMKCGNEMPVEGLSCRNTGNRFQFTMVQERYFILANSFSGAEKFLPVMLMLTRHILASIPEGEPIRLLDHLPKENLVAESELIVRGPYALQSIFTFGEGDVLRLEGEVWGVIGDYRRDEGDVFTRIIILYPDEAAAAAAYENLVSNLDPYLDVLERWGKGFIFEDYREEYGMVELQGERLAIMIHLLERPERLVDGS